MDPQTSDASANARPISVALVEDEPSARERLERAIKSTVDLQLVVSLESGREALVWLEKNRPDVLLCDLGLPDIPGLAVITYCAKRHPACDIMVVTLYEDEAHVMRCLEAGASGYILKDGLNSEIAAQVREMRNGGVPMTPIVARMVLKRMRAPAQQESAPVSAVPPMITKREQVILTHISKGFSYAEIAGLEGISVMTVATHIRNIYAKLSVHSRSEAVYEAAQLGLIDTALALR